MTRAHITVKSSKITKPLLAGRVEGQDLATLKFPLGMTTKIDGIRCLMIDEQAVSRTFKPIANTHIRTLLEKYMPNGMDMELTSGEGFQECSGNIMREDGEPEFHVWVIDYVVKGLDMPYEERMGYAKAWLDTVQPPFAVSILMPTIAKNKADIEAYEAKMLAAGFEGIMLRDLNAPYKCGRSTFKEGILIKVKRFSDCEAVVTAVEEQMHNENEAERDAFGRTKRSQAQDGKTAAGTLGCFVVKGHGGDYHGVEFRVGTGLTAAQRDTLWADRKNLIGKIIKVKYFPTGVKDAPRFPTFVGFRDKRDM
jgi:DNA ligase-1